MPTPDRFPGVREDEGIVLTDEATDPTTVGEIRNNAGVIRAKDSIGVFDIHGITEVQHEALDRLTHDINETSFDEYIYTGNVVTNIIVWTSAAKTLKIREEQLTYSGNKVTQVVMIQYDGAGVEKERNTEAFVYSGVKVQDVTRTHA